MSQYGLIYRMEFKNIEGYTIRTDIYPTDVLIGDSDDPVIIPLKGGEQPVVISASNNDEDKFTPIRSKSAKIQFVSDAAGLKTAATFSEGSDNLWRVDISLTDNPSWIFRGFLMMADNQAPFQPDPQYVTLTASDHLAALKEVALTDTDGSMLQGEYTIAEIIAKCLWKTGLDLSCFVINNIRVGSQISPTTTTFQTVGPLKQILVPDTNAPFFYPGQTITVTGTSSNNTTFVVVSSSSSGGTTTAVVTGTISAETSASAVLTDSLSTTHLYAGVYLDIKTFEESIGVLENCYSVLSKILGEDCYITQWLGQWWIMRVDEFDTNPLYIAEFTDLGVYVGTTTDTINKSIGAIELQKFANADTLLRFVRPHQFSRETFRYVNPLEVPCNKDFTRGDFIADISDTEKTYDLDCWTLKCGAPGFSNPVLGTTDTIHRIFNANDYEIEKYIVLTPRSAFEASSINQITYIESEPIPVNINDKFDLSADFRLTNTTAGSPDVRLLRAVLAGDDGSYWLLGETTVGDNNHKWFNTSGFTVNSTKGEVNIDTSVDTWQSISWNAPAVPVAGNIYIWFNQFRQNSNSFYNQDIQYSNLSFDYIPFINGGYAKYTGQSSKVSRTAAGYLANRDREVYISDAPTRLTKGALIVHTGAGASILAPNFWDAHPFGNSYPPDAAWLHPFGYIQAFSVWNQYRGTDGALDRGVGINIFSGSVKGLTNAWPDLLHKYTLNDSNTMTNNRYFMLISLQQDWKSCVWTGVFIEVYNLIHGKTYSDPFEFKYLTS